jgi:TolA-binding protein
MNLSNMTFNNSQTKQIQHRVNRLGLEIIMKYLLLNIFTSCTVAAMTALILIGYDPISILNVNSEQPRSLTSTDNKIKKLQEVVTELSQIQTGIHDRLSNIDITLQSMESSFQDTSVSLWNELTHIQQVSSTYSPSEVPANSTISLDTQTQREDTVFNGNTEKTYQEPSPDQHIAKMDAVFYDQEADQTWDDIAREQIYNNYISARPSGVQLQDLSCTGALCRMEILQEADFELSELSSGDEPLVPWDHRARAASIQNPDGSTTTVMYISRQGYNLPDL